MTWTQQLIRHLREAAKHTPEYAGGLATVDPMMLITAADQLEECQASLFQIYLLACAAHDPIGKQS